MSIVIINGLVHHDQVNRLSHRFRDLRSITGNHATGSARCTHSPDPEDTRPSLLCVIRKCLYLLEWIGNWRHSHQEGLPEHFRTIDLFCLKGLTFTCNCTTAFFGTIKGSSYYIPIFFTWDFFVALGFGKIF